MAVASAGALSVTISAVDRLSAPLVKMNTGVARLGASIGRLGNATRTSLGLDRLGAVAGSVARNMALIVPPLSALTAAGTLAGVMRLATGWASVGAQLGRTAYRVQTTASALQVMQGAARLAGSSAEDLAQGLEGMGDALSDAVGGRDDTAVQYFRLLGIGMRDAAGNARSAADVLPEVADRIAAIADPRLQARVMGALRLPAGLLPYLRQGAAGMREYEAEARRAGAISEEGAEAARLFELAQTRLNLAGQGLTNTLSARLAPVLVPLLDRLSNWLIAKGPQLGAIVEDLAGRFSTWVDDGGLTRLGERLEAVGNGFSSVIGWMGGMENAATLLGAVLIAKVVSPLTRIVALAGGLGAAGLAGLGGRAAALVAGAGAGAATGTAAVAATAGSTVAAAFGAAGLVAGVAALAGRQWRENEVNGVQPLLQRRRNFGERARQRNHYAEGDDGSREGGTWRDLWESAARPFVDISEALARQIDTLTRVAPERATGLAPGGARRATQDALPGPEVTGRQGGVPRGIRNNNPLNLTFHPGQIHNNPGLRTDGRFGIYPTMEDGIAQSVRQMQIHATLRGARTLGQMIGIWAPPQENDTPGYVGRVAAETGLDPNAQIDWNDAETLRRIVAAMTRMENGRGIDPAQIERGVNQGLGRPATVAPEASRQGVDVRVTLAGPGSEGATIRTQTGDGVRIERPALGAGP